ncbi:ribonuclease T2 [Palleronia marisminoris]|uniref:Ribonuclease T2 family protein n=1 Tax=Palleronia marisminoris TaxID=315423 RepID=A0A1Y5T1J6_9RHOB|nr:ribonuclease T2 [Palleronia marisminoris]SFH13825.1 ribonuclease T2 [Palleronia marisminoris]SLN53791.1 Ribonuclease T2 family protein [Palleronia marisminoris]
MLRVLAVLIAFALPARADEAGAFDYYVLSLSWSPTWCALEGDAQGSPQCDRPLGWILHGLWPQHENGYPEYCATNAADPSRAETAAMADIMGTGGLAWHEWQKHGRCSGLTSDGYFERSRDAYAAIERPEVLRQLEDPVRLPARVVEEAFLKANPGLFPDAITITCRSGRVQEARICLTRDDLTPRRCGADVIRDCTLADALLDPIR